MASNKILKNASIVMIYSLIAKFSSFVVELLVASNLGVSHETDAFYMVYGIVQIIYPMISVGIWKVYLPEYKTRTVLGKNTAASEVTNQLLSIFSIVAVLIITIIAAFPQWIIRIFAPGFDEDTFFISETLLRIVIFIILFNTIATFSSAILQSWGNFAKAQVKDIVFHIPTLAYLVVFRSYSTVNGVAYSILVGAVLAAIIEYLFGRARYRYRIPVKLVDTEVIKIIKQVPVACLNSIINQLNSVIDKIFASTLQMGAVTYLNYGGKLIHLFDGIFSTAISTALFPYVTELVAKGKVDKLKDFLKTYTVLIFLILSPITFLLVIFSKEIVGLVFGHGKFGEEEIEQTALVLLTYAFGLILMCLTTIVNDIFYILKRTRILLWTTVANIISNIFLDIIFVRNLGVAGLSLATTISLLIVIGLKLFFIRDVLKLDFDLLKLIGQIITYCIIGTCAILGVDVFTSINSYVRLFLGVLVFVIIYALLVLGINKRMREMLMSSIRNLSHGGRKS